MRAMEGYTCRPMVLGMHMAHLYLIEMWLKQLATITIQELQGMMIMLTTITFDEEITSFLDDKIFKLISGVSFTTHPLFGCQSSFPNLSIFHSCMTSISFVYIFFAVRQGEL